MYVKFLKAILKKTTFGTAPSPSCWARAARHNAGHHIPIFLIGFLGSNVVGSQDHPKMGVTLDPFSDQIVCLLFFFSG